jgi:hypothetical protein
VVDESHSLGVLGNNGCGIFFYYHNKNIKRKIMVASLGKSNRNRWRASDQFSLIAIATAAHLFQVLEPSLRKQWDGSSL